jgi:GntR family transcriptional regulator/MocR family aminotransferase
VLIPLKLVRDQQLQQQIFDQLRDLIVSGRLRPGSRMPSSRMMAEQFAISRMTVLLTYERLIAEGYLETRPATGTFVAHPKIHARVPSIADTSALSLAHATGTMPGSAQPDHGGPSHARLTAAPEPDARVGGADPSLFPTQRWRTLMRQRLDNLGGQFGAEHPAGSPALRDAIVSWLSTSRGVAVSPDQVMLVRGRQQALHVVAHLASHPCEGRRANGRSLSGLPAAPGNSHSGSNRPLPVHAKTLADHPAGCPVGSPSWPGDQTRIVVEDPCDADAAAAMAGEGGILVRVPVDAEGLRTDHLPDGEAALIHVTPEHQRPLGSILSRDRRIALLQWAARAGALILEEDIDGELRYGGMTAPSLMSLDRSERVILLGGFSVSLGPWLDVAYMVLPRWLVPFALAARRLIDDSRSTLEQAALADFLGGGGYARHVHRLTRTYASRRDALLAALRHHLGGPAMVWGEHAGLHLAWFPPAETGLSTPVAALARNSGLEATALPPGTRGAQPVLLGFGLLPERQIEARVGRFAGMLRSGIDTGLAEITRSAG